MRANAGAAVNRTLGKVTGTETVRQSAAHKAAVSEFKASVPKPSTPAPSGEYQIGHKVDLQHNTSGKVEVRDLHWEDARTNVSEGSSNMNTQRGKPGISGQQVLAGQGKNAPTQYGGVSTQANASAWYNSPNTRTTVRGAGTGLVLYGVYQSGDEVASAIVDDALVEGSNGQHTIRAVATQAGGWAGALALGAKGAAIGAVIGAPVAGIGGLVGGVVGGLIGGGLGFFIGSTLAEEAIEVGVEATGAQNYVPSDIR
jgi:hypothetical protein